MKEVNYLTYTLDDNYIIPFLVSAYSAKSCFPLGTTISILQPKSAESTMGLSQAGLAMVEKCLTTLEINYQIENVNVDSFDENKLPLWARFSRTTWLRYYYLFNSSDSLSYIHYVEPDMLFINSTLNLFDYKPPANALSARTSPGHEDFENKWHSTCDKPWYFNCGVMVVDVARWRSTVNQKFWWEVVSDFEKLEFKVIDQDALNYVLRGHQDILPPELNQYPSEYNQKQTSLIHFAGHYKPWVFRPTWLRRKLKPPIKQSMNLWDATLESVKEIIQSNSECSKVFRDFPPKVNVGSRLTIAFPRVMQLIFKFRAFIPG